MVGAEVTRGGSRGSHVVGTEVTRGGSRGSTNCVIQYLVSYYSLALCDAPRKMETYVGNFKVEMRTNGQSHDEKSIRTVNGQAEGDRERTTGGQGQDAGGDRMKGTHR